jgi:hypothetical protein
VTLGLLLFISFASACGGGGSSGGVPTASPIGSATPIATTTPGTGPTASATIAYPASGGAVALPAVSNYSGTINLTAASSGAGAQTTIAAQAYSPAGLPVIQMKRRSTSQSNDPLLWITFTATTTLTLSGYPGFVITLPSASNTNGSFSLAFYDPTHASLGWQPIGGPTSATEDVVIFTAGSTPVTFAANQTYVFALYETPNAPTPSPTSSATAGPTTTPQPGAVPQLTETSFPVDSDFQPTSIIAASDGNLWFTECPTTLGGNGAIDKMTVAGVTTTYPLTGLPERCAFWIVNGPDGALWFTEFIENGTGTPSIGRIDLSGNITEYPVAQSQNYLALGSDNNLWYTAKNGGSVYGFNPTTHTTVGSATLPTGYSAAYLANNPQTNEMVVVAISTTGNSPPGEIFSFQPGASPSATLRYSAASNSGNASAFGPLAMGADGNFYSAVFTNTSTQGQELLQLSTSTYSASYVNLPTSFIFEGSTVSADFGPPVVLMGGNVFLPNGLVRASVRGIAELSTSGVLLGQADNDYENPNAGWMSGTVGPDGNVWFAVPDQDASQGWIERIQPVGSSGGATRVRH